ncbi:tigger transposable element-derived protein 4-like [Mobula birostris]|uniref:tigger transposable element-derived protein 4-like n=1 Tax=Mobula birostris TaxID=1983395 RepID=UPI003B282552
MPRKDLTLAEKITVLDQIKSHPPNTTHRQLAVITGVPKSTIARLIQQQDKLREEWALCEGQQGTSQKRKREGKNPDVEKALNQWFSVVTGRGVRVSGPMLKNKSEELAKKLGHRDFKATDGWLSRWKCRHHIQFKKTHGEKSGSDALNAEAWKSTKLPDLLQKFCADDIYNADETGLFYRAILSGTKKAIDRITVLCCSNMSGTDKKKLLVIGKSVKPRCFKGLRMDSLPIEYYANKNAWMTSDIFKNWLMSWDMELQRKSRKVLLLVDNCAAYPNVECLKNIQLEFLPASRTYLVQPMDMGIIKKLKTLYRRKLVNHILEAIEENLLTSSATAKEVCARVNLLHAIQFVTDSWREISSKTIQNCFALCGFKHSGFEMTEMAGSENETISVLEQVGNCEEFEGINNHLECYNENEDLEDAIVESIVSIHQGRKYEDEESDQDDTSEPELVTTQDARKFIVGLQRYFMQEGNEGSPLSALSVCADFVHLQSIKRKRLRTLDEFLRR